MSDTEEGVRNGHVKWGKFAGLTEATICLPGGGTVEFPLVPLGSFICVNIFVMPWMGISIEFGGSEQDSFCFDNQYMDEDFRRKLQEIKGISDALLLKTSLRVSLLREGWRLCEGWFQFPWRLTTENVADDLM
ncbi:hypothetical protein NE237_013791 [Protea cynaroides]|uniref:EH domain-containing protein n=1 Tax=Protea cynaroides TaxID=273540 RepID=A0A9Q0H2D7_9MAGN|nr:hypothetical protein NE237_013791 [Protea cynaroides]